MRKILFTLLMLVPMLACAYDVEIDGIYYNLVSKTKMAEVTNETGDEYAKSYSGSVTIPSTIIYEGNTYTVTSINDYAFSYCKGLTSITIPNSVSRIGEWAFSECARLTSITIPNSVTCIKYATFCGCM